MGKKSRYTDEQFIRAVKDSGSVKQVLEKIGLVQAGGNYAHVKELIDRMGLDTSHFHGQGWRKNKYDPIYSLHEIMVRNSTYRTCALKERLFKEGIKQNKCEECGMTKWRDKHIAMELHHINGVCNDHRLKNLKILCPNCHSQTKHFRGRK